MECSASVLNQVKAFFVREFGKNFNFNSQYLLGLQRSQIICNVFENRLTGITSKLCDLRDFATPGKFSL